MQFPSGKNIRIPLLDDVDHPVQEIQLTVHHSARYRVQPQTFDPSLLTIDYSIPRIISSVFGRVGKCIIFILVAKAYRGDFVFLGIR